MKLTRQGIAVLVPISGRRANCWKMAADNFCDAFVPIANI
jgi:hypothetical protein